MPPRKTTTSNGNDAPRRPPASPFTFTFTEEPTVRADLGEEEIIPSIEREESPELPDFESDSTTIITSSQTYRNDLLAAINRNAQADPSLRLEFLYPQPPPSTGAFQPPSNPASPCLTSRRPSRPPPTNWRIGWRRSMGPLPRSFRNTVSRTRTQRTNPAISEPSRSFHLSYCHTAC